MAGRRSRPWPWPRACGCPPLRRLKAAGVVRAVSGYSALAIVGFTVLQLGKKAVIDKLRRGLVAPGAGR